MPLQCKSFCTWNAAIVSFILLIVTSIIFFAAPTAEAEPKEVPAAKTSPEVPVADSAAKPASPSPEKEAVSTSPAPTTQSSSGPTTKDGKKAAKVCQLFIGM